MLAHRFSASSPRKALRTRFRKDKMAAVKPQAHAPLTADMEAALQLLARSTDRALVRLYSQSWVLESDKRNGVNQLTAESIEAGRPVSDRPVVHTHTVDGLVAARALAPHRPQAKRPRLQRPGPGRSHPAVAGERATARSDAGFRPASLATWSGFILVSQSAITVFRRMDGPLAT